MNCVEFLSADSGSMGARKLAQPTVCSGATAELLSPPPVLSVPAPSLMVMRQFAPEQAALEQLIEVLCQLVLHGSQCESVSTSTTCAFRVVE
jgi:hypothetical protein